MPMCARVFTMTSMQQKEAPPPLDLADAPQWMRVDQVARVAQVHPRTVRRWIGAGYLRSSKPSGGRLLIDRESVRSFIEGAIR